MIKFKDKYLGDILNSKKRTTYRLLLEDEVVEKIKTYRPKTFHSIILVDKENNSFRFNFDKKLKITKCEVVNLLDLKVEKIQELREIYNLEMGKEYLFLKLSFCLVPKEAKGFR